MSVYTLQKLLRDVNRIPERRAAYFRSSAEFSETYDLTGRQAVKPWATGVGLMSFGAAA